MFVIICECIFVILWKLGFVCLFGKKSGDLVVVIIIDVEVLEVFFVYIILLVFIVLGMMIVIVGFLVSYDVGLVLIFLLG